MRDKHDRAAAPLELEDLAEALALELLVADGEDLIQQQDVGIDVRRNREPQARVHAGPGVGSSGVSGIQTVVLKGDPTKAGVYTILLRVPANTTIQAHSHPDDRVATVVSGTWNFGYGTRFDEKALKALPPGSFYTEPPHEPHFARTGDTAVDVQISGFGPSGTVYENPDDDPASKR